jgi:hypothetical protein
MASNDSSSAVCDAMPALMALFAVLSSVEPDAQSSLASLT